MGVGILHLFVAKNDEERRITLNSIGPVWDGNEVWLVLGGGVLFAAFPLVYASLFSGFYLAFMLVLAGDDPAHRGDRVPQQAPRPELAQDLGLCLLDRFPGPGAAVGCGVWKRAQRRADRRAVAICR